MSHLSDSIFLNNPQYSMRIFSKQSVMKLITLNPMIAPLKSINTSRTDDVRPTKDWKNSSIVAQSSTKNKA